MGTGSIAQWVELPHKKSWVQYLGLHKLGMHETLSQKIKIKEEKCKSKCYTHCYKDFFSYKGSTL